MALPKPSTDASNTYAAPHLGSATSPTTSPAASSKPEDSDPNYTLNYEEPVNRVPRELASGFLDRVKWQLAEEVIVKVERREIWLNFIALIVFLLLFVYDAYVKVFWLAGLNGIIVVILLVRLFKIFNSFKKHKELFARKLGGSY